MRRLLILIACPLVIAAPAEAATFQMHAMSGKADVLAAPGELNKVTLVEEAAATLATDTGGLALAAGAGCDQVTPSSVRCPTKVIKAELGDLDDTLSVSGGIQTDIDPGAGADTIEGGSLVDEIAARDGARDVITCGGGQDTGEADFNDEVAADCESVVKSLAPAPVGPTVPVPTPPTTPAPDGTTTPVAAPVPGKSFGGAVRSGVVTVMINGTPVPLDPSVPIPAGATVDATKGTIALSAAADSTGAVQTANFTGGKFAVTQKLGTRMVTDLKLRGGNFSGCGSRTASRTTARAASKRKVRRLWGSGKGRFRTHGSHAVATVRGTTWSVTDRCDGTLTRVEHGVVVVDDLKRKRSKVLRRGQSYLARR